MDAMTKKRSQSAKKRKQTVWEEKKAKSTVGVSSKAQSQQEKYKAEKEREEKEKEKMENKKALDERDLYPWPAVTAKLIKPEEHIGNKGFARDWRPSWRNREEDDEEYFGISK